MKRDCIVTLETVTMLPEVLYYNNFHIQVDTLEVLPSIPTGDGAL